ncbi:MAG TPA: hypothetical protein VFM55_06795 [Micromonosporaceae bacterium]|nr:hypothetical protein [Micromonosporaceae bacterium]
MLRLSRRLGVTLGVAVITALALPGMASADVSHRFSANSGDRCGYGYTSGHMTWSSTAPVVSVTGSVVDNPVDSTFPCRDDGRTTVAHFVAFSLNGAVDRQAVRADNSEQAFAFRLGTSTSTSRLTQVTVQVCRHSSSTVADYCGETKTYRNPA